MKKMMRFAAVLLCAVLLISCVSCVKDRDESLPEGMKLATAAGADFRLYIPTSWNTNTAYGVSGGYYSMSTQSSVSVVKYPITEEMAAALDAADLGAYADSRLEWFWVTECLSAIEGQALSGSVGKGLTDAEGKAVDAKYIAAEDLLNKVNARNFRTNAIVNGETLHVLQVVAEKDGAFYVFSFMAGSDLYTGLLSHVELMLDNFIFAEPYTPDAYVKELDENAEAPEGMKLASNDDVAYRFYVPADWTVTRDEQIFSAYVESDRANVSVVPYSPETDGMSVAEFYTMCAEMMGSAAGEGFEELSHEETTLGGRNATAYRYNFTVGGTQYSYLQVIAVYRSMVYSVTYTARPEHFDSHMEDVEAILDAFAFR